MRAAWLAQELLTTFETKVVEVALVPSSGGIFEIRLDGEVLYSNKTTHAFPEAKVIKQMVRDRIAPDMKIGHSD